MANLSGANALSTDNVIFNRNRIGIDFDYSRNSSSNFNLVYYPVSVKNSIFTCRDIPFTLGSLVWVPFATFKNTSLSSITNYPNTPETNSAPYVEETQYSSTNANAYLKLPFTTNTKSQIGINSSGSTHYNGWYKIGNELNTPTSNNVTLFDNQTVGIKMFSTDIEVVNCTFQNVPNANPIIETYGILAEHNDEANFHLETKAAPGRPHNAFFDCRHAIVSKFYTQVNIQNTDIRSNKKVSLGNVKEGYGGVAISTSSFGWSFYGNTINISNNEMLNIAYPITLKFDDFPWRAYNGIPPSDPTALSNSIEINNNWLHVYSRSRSQQTPGYFIQQAINLAVVVPSVVNSSVIFPPLRCNANLIGGAFHAIRISNWEAKDVRVLNNLIDLNFHGVNSATTSGIDLLGCIPQTAGGNWVYRNRLAGSNSSPGFNYNTNQTSGITIDNGSGYTERCNLVYGALRAMYHFKGTLTNTSFLNNRMEPDQIYGNNWGLLLNNAVIGQQGNAAAACDNDYSYDYYWLSNTYKTFCFNSDAQQSPMFVQNTYEKNLIYFNGCGAFGSPAIPYGTSNGSIQYAPANGYNCPIITSRTFERNLKIIPASTGEPDETPEEGARSSRVETEIKQLVEAEALAQGLTVQGGSSEPALRLYVAQMQLYRFLLSPNGWAAKSPILSGFVAQHNSTSFGIINNIAKKILEGNTAAALQQLGSWAKTNRVDDNYAKFFYWTIRRRQGAVLNLVEIEQLAMRCPQTDGNVVFAAQNLYNAITNGHQQFVTSCDDNSQATQAARTRQAQKSSEPVAKGIALFPNPAEGFVTVQGSKIRKVELFSASGAFILSKAVSADAVTLPLQQLTSGVYIVRITDAANNITLKKIIKSL